MHSSIGEAVGRGHPDKICDQVSDLLLDTLLKLDSNAHVACEVMLFNHWLTISGEVNCKQLPGPNWKLIAEEQVKSLLSEIMPSRKTVAIKIECHDQSRELSDVKGANDQCVVTGYATNETEEMLPLAQVLANEILQKIDYYRSRHTPPFTFVMTDMKSLVWINYDSHSPLIKVMGTISVQHQELSKNDFNDLRHNLTWKIIQPILKKYDLPYQAKNWTINNAGPWEHGGPDADTGVTGRKIMVDSYGPNIAHGGGAFSGKDISKTDRFGAYFCRYVAKNIVYAQLAERCLVKMAFQIDGDQPIDIEINTFGSGHDCTGDQLVTALKKLNQDARYNFSFKISDIIQQMKLLPSQKYQDLAVYGHFGRLDLEKIPWEVKNEKFINEIKMILKQVKQS